MDLIYLAPSCRSCLFSREDHERYACDIRISNLAITRSYLTVLRENKFLIIGKTQGNLAFDLLKLMPKSVTYASCINGSYPFNL